MEEHSKDNSGRQRSRLTVERQPIRQKQQSYNPGHGISTRHFELMSEEMMNVTKNKVSLDTPCRKIASLKLEVKVTPNPAKQSKLLSSKSLSQLVPRKLFFVRTKAQQAGNPSKEGASNESKDKNTIGNLQTTKSLTNAAFQFDPSLDSTLKHDIINGSSAVTSVSLIGFSGQSTCNSFAQSSSSNSYADYCSITRPNISPIVGDSLIPTAQRPIGDIATSTPQETKAGTKHALRKRQTTNRTKDKKNVTGDIKSSTTAANCNRYRPFKNTALVLRDVKNSIGLRMKARHQSKAFAKLDEEVATPPSKLYSPFNIYTPESKVVSEEVGQVYAKNQLSPQLINFDESLSSVNLLLRDNSDSC